MRCVSRIPLIGAAIVVVALAIVLLGEALNLGGVYYLVAFFIGLFVIGLTDRDRFYGADLRRGHR